MFVGSTSFYITSTKASPTILLTQKSIIKNMSQKFVKNILGQKILGREE